MLNQLSEKQEELLSSVSEEWVEYANGGKSEIDQITARRSIKKIYEMADLTEPDVLFFSGPMKAIRFCKEQLKTDVDTFDFFGCGFDSGWCSFYDYFQRIGIVNENDEEFNYIKDFMRSGVWATIMFDGLIICIARPSVVKTDEQGNLHCEDGPAIAFDDGYEEYSWHGTWVDEKLIMRPSEINNDDIKNETNSEIHRAIAERIGWDRYMETLGTVLVDKWFDPDQKLHYELYDFKERRFELMPRLLKMESPETLAGKKPHYIEPVDPGLATCQSARKWQFKKPDGTWPSVEECNRNPELTFNIET